MFWKDPATTSRAAFKLFKHLKISGIALGGEFDTQQGKACQRSLGKRVNPFAQAGPVMDDVESYAINRCKFAPSVAVLLHNDCNFHEFVRFRPPTYMKSLIWKTPANLEKLREFLLQFVKQTDFTEETIVQALSESEKNPDLRPTARALRNFIGGETKKPTKTEAYDTLTCWVVKYVEEHSVQSLIEDPNFPDIKQLSTTISASTLPTRMVSPNDLSAAMTLVATLLKCDQAYFTRLEKQIFRPTDEFVERKRFERHFLCYRYHSTPGNVVKSFLAVMGRSPESPGICRFLHFSQGTSGGQRMSSGVILPFQNATYFLGHAGDGEGLKIIALRNFAPAKPVQEGLVISFDDDSSLAAARIILVDTAYRDSRSANIGVIRDTNLEPDVAKYRSRLRNRIDFKLTERLLLNGRQIDQQGMVVAVGDALKDVDGNPKLTDGNGQAFNPAADRHYTFNSALKIWSDDEDEI